jgi:glycosyltransferase involved in cell wall biosynthesis
MGLFMNVNTENVPYTFESVVLKYLEETKDLISVIIPIYNADLYLREALNSVIAQTFQNWEAILVDDGSTDKSAEICIEYTEKDSRFKYIRKNNEGTLWARKTGLENSKGEFIANLDSDDAYCPQFLEKMVAKLKKGNNDFVWCDADDLDGKEGIWFSSTKFCEDKFENCYKFREFGATLWIKLVKRNIYAKILFPRINISLDEDPIQILQITYHSNQAERVPDVLYLHRMGSAISVSRTYNVISKENKRIQYILSNIAIYMLMKQLVGKNNAEKIFSETAFINYFRISKKTIVRHKIEYVHNFIPAFFNGLKKSKKYNLFRKVLLMLACKIYPSFR